MKKILFFISALICLLGCQDGRQSRAPFGGETTIGGISEDHWTYFSFEKGDMVGTSKYLNLEEDAEWAERRDWDFAICGDYIKTNSGTSGVGRGGVLKNTTNTYDGIKTAPSSGYIVDSIRIAR